MRSLNLKKKISCYSFSPHCHLNLMLYYIREYKTCYSCFPYGIIYQVILFLGKIFFSTFTRLILRNWTIIIESFCFAIKYSFSSFSYFGDSLHTLGIYSFFQIIFMSSHKNFVTAVFFSFFFFFVQFIWNSRGWDYRCFLYESYNHVPTWRTVIEWI